MTAQSLTVSMMLALTGAPDQAFPNAAPVGSTSVRKVHSKAEGTAPARIDPMNASSSVGRSLARQSTSAPRGATSSPTGQVLLAQATAPGTSAPSPSNLASPRSPFADSAPTTSMLQGTILDTTEVADRWLPTAMGRRGWVSAEFLLWWVKGSDTPPLVTTSDPNSNPVDPGYLGNPTTQVLYGGNLPNNVFSGGRFAAGTWLTDGPRPLGIEFGGFFLGSQSDSRTFDSSQYPVVARPAFIVNDNSENSDVAGFPGVVQGGVTVNNSFGLWGAGVNLTSAPFGAIDLCDTSGFGPRWQVMGLGGFRFLQARDDVEITEFGTILPNQIFPNRAGEQFVVRDSFAANNSFYGGNLGIAVERRWSRFFVNFRGSVALGTTHQTLKIAGSQVVTPFNGTPQDFSGGLLALPSNIGTFERDVFGVVPEIGLNIGTWITRHWRVYAGYSLLYWSDVIRSGEQISLRLDGNQIPNFVALPPTNQVAPRPTFSSNDLWAHGINLGMQFVW